MKYIIGNWKENPDTLETAQKLLSITKSFTQNEGSTEYRITHAVPSLFAGYLMKEDKDTPIILQNISCFEGGSHTGEISALQAKNIGIQASIVGHSETRLNPQNPRGDEDKEVNLKIKNLFKEGMWTVLCVGEFTRDGVDFKKYINNQIENCLKDISNPKNLAIAYEPVWAIGKDAKRPATNEEIVDTIKSIKEYLTVRFGTNTIPVLYGGSVDENNAKEIVNLESVDGLLIGRASSEATKWETLLNNLIKEKEMKTIDTLHIQPGKRVLLRLDLNVPMTESGEISDDFRIKESIPTILLLQEKGACVIILAHKEEGSLEKVGEYLNNVIQNFSFIKETTPHSLNMENGQVVLLENVRADKREKSKEESERDALAKEWSILGDYYINEAFSACHRNHASITSLPKFLPSAMGPKLINEISKLGGALHGEHPMLLILGGAKFETKLGLLEKFNNIADTIFVGGALAHTFWKTRGQEIGTSLIDDEVALSTEIISSNKILLPDDVLNQDNQVKTLPSVLPTDKIMDFGPHTLSKITEIAQASKTVIWNGPLGYYEKGFDKGTIDLLHNLGKMTDKTIVLGGGDTVAVVQKVVNDNKDLSFTHISTGGGAMIDFLSNGTLPGIEAIK